MSQITIDKIKHMSLLRVNSCLKMPSYKKTAFSVPKISTSKGKVYSALHKPRCQLVAWNGNYGVSNVVVWMWPFSNEALTSNIQRLLQGPLL